MANNKDAYYFSHDSNARNDEKIIALRMKHGMEGYGIYFAILERMREEKDYFHVKDYNIIAFDLRVSNSLIKSVVENFGLFQCAEDGSRFYSKSFLERMNAKDKTKLKLSEAGKSGGGNPNFKKGKPNPYYQEDSGEDKDKDKPPLCVEINNKKKGKESKEKKETLSIEREKKKPPPEEKFEILEEVEKAMLSDDEHISVLCRNNQHLKPDLTPEDVRAAIRTYFRKLENEGVRLKTLSDAKSHFARWWSLEQGKKPPDLAVTGIKRYTYEQMAKEVYNSGGFLTTSHFELQRGHGEKFWIKKSDRR
jgi:hypothetical protein